MRTFAFDFAKKLHRQKKLQRELPDSWLKCGRASKDWWTSFKTRNNDLSLRVAENLSTARAEAFNKFRVEKYFADLVKIFEEIGIGDFPQLIYNCDETGLSSVPSTGKKVVALKGKRLVQKMQTAERGTLTTLLPCVNGTGSFIPPFLVFKGTPLPDVGAFPSDTVLSSTKSGYIDAETFLVFLKHFEKHRFHLDDKPVALFIDGHGSHLSIEALEYCKTNKIELVCIPPHTSHRLQPLDTHFNGPLKKCWSDEVSELLRNKEKVILTKYQFHEVFNIVWQKMLTTMRPKIVGGFQHCGIFPLGNPVKDDEFNLSRSFSVNKENLPPSTTDFILPRQSEPVDPPRLVEDGVALRTLMPSPEKIGNPKHIQPHEPAVTSDDFLAKKREKKKPKAKSAKAKAPKRVLPLTSHSDDNKCDICGIVFAQGTAEDFIKCPICCSWVCESCFGADACADCI